MTAVTSSNGKDQGIDAPSATRIRTAHNYDILVVRGECHRCDRVHVGVIDVATPLNPIHTVLHLHDVSYVISFVDAAGHVDSFKAFRGDDRIDP